ncbi:unnamed protein product [Angiostrongylus costaricensis]|uniref:Vacuolar protein sorting-associated protein 53 homolog n=1 Tax=Angiostrongylus costaricensis TaxID=334426 RepID=A0A0R3PKD9_ANGCS|nr:unnamed protein product [Angiostrongylus costaricensis]
MVEIVCTALHIRETCDGMASMLLGALKISGEQHVCSMIGLCGGNGSLLDVSFILKPLTSKVESALGSLVNITSDAQGLLGDSINQTTGGIRSLIDGSKQIGEKFKKTFPFFGRRKRSNVDEASASSGQESDHIFEEELHSNLRGEQHWMPSSALKVAKKFLEQLEAPLPENATDVEKALYYLTKGMKEKTLKAINKKIEKSSAQ